MQYSTSKENLQHFRDHILQNWRVARQGESKIRLKKLLDDFISAIAVPPPTNTKKGSAAKLVDDVLARFKNETNLFRELKEIAMRCRFQLFIDRGIQSGEKDFRLYSGLRLVLWTNDVKAVIDFLRCQDWFPEQLILSTEEDLRE